MTPLEKKRGALLRHLFRFCHQLILQLVVILFTLLLFVGIPILFLFFLLPIYIFRFILFKTSKYIRPDLGKMLTALSSSFVVRIPFVYDRPKNTFAVYAVLDGHVDMVEFRQNFLRLLTVKSTENPKELMYQEFTQYLTKFLGFYFWKDEENFNIEEHVKFYPTNEQYSDLENGQTVVNLVGDVLKKPFTRKQSPWEFLVLYNNPVVEDLENPGKSKKTSLVVIRLHHCLSDGFSLFKFVLEHARATGKVEQKQSNFQKLNVKPKIHFKSDSEPEPNKETKAKANACDSQSDERERKSKGNLSRTLRSIFFPLRFPYEVAWQFIHCTDRNPWHLPESKMSRNSCGFVTQTIPTQYIKDIKNSSDASFAGVILAAFAGGIRKSMLENKSDGNDEEKKKIPQHINCLTPLPLPNHTLKLRNYMTACFVKLPLGAVEDKPMDARTRLREIEKNIQSIKDSTMLQTNYVVHKASGCLPAFLLEQLWKPTLCTCTLSSFPGPESEAVYLGHHMSDTGFLGNIDVGNLGLSMTLFSYNGNIRICIGADKSILRTRKEVEDLMRNIMNELDLLYHDEIV